jgi:hypothetical protein
MKLAVMLLVLAAVFFVACLAPRTLMDSQGREFVRVRAASEAGDGIRNAELWQQVGEVGDAFPFYLRLLTPEGQAPLFTRAL